MIPAEYVNTVVAPNVRRFLAARSDVSLAYASCVLTYHVADHIAFAEGQYGKGRVLDHLNGFCCVALRCVQGLCNGTKHPRRGPHAHPGDERVVPAFAFDTPGAGWDQGRWEVPGLMLEHGDQQLFVDDAVQAMLLAYRHYYPQHLLAADLSFVDQHLSQAHDAAVRSSP